MINPQRDASGSPAFTNIYKAAGVCLSKNIFGPACLKLKTSQTLRRQTPLGTHTIIKLCCAHHCSELNQFLVKIRIRGEPLLYPT